MKENGDKFPQDKKTEIENLIVELKKDLGSKDVESIKSKSEKLGTLVSEVVSEMYKNTQSTDTSGQPSDVEFEEVK